MIDFKSMTPEQQVEYLSSPKFQDEFWEHVEGTVYAGGCFTWRGFGNPYGRFRVGKHDFKAHRLSYMMANGPIPDDLVIDHRCSNKMCVNAEHLRAVTHQQNSEHKSSRNPHNPTGYRGVTWSPLLGKYHASANSAGKFYSAGYYETIEEARVAVSDLRSRIHTHDDHDEWEAEFGMTNIDPEEYLDDTIGACYEDELELQ